MPHMDVVVTKPQVEPPTFTLHPPEGTPPEEWWSETFTALARPPASIMEALLSAAQSSKDGNLVFFPPSLLAYLRGVIVDEDMERFEATISDKAKQVHSDDLGKVVMWLIEVQTENPSMPPST